MQQLFLTSITLSILSLFFYGCKEDIKPNLKEINIYSKLTESDILNNYNDEIEQLLTWVKSAKPLPGFSQIYAPGEMENNSKKNRLDTGIDVPDSVWEKILVISKK